MVKIIIGTEGGIRMKRMNNYFQEKKTEETIDLYYNDYEELFDKGYSDNEISREMGVSEVFIKRLRDEYLRDY
jgi:hypothetical protein